MNLPIKLQSYVLLLHKSGLLHKNFEHNEASISGSERYLTLTTELLLNNNNISSHDPISDSFLGVFYDVNSTYAVQMCDTTSRPLPPCPPCPTTKFTFSPHCRRNRHDETVFGSLNRQLKYECKLSAYYGVFSLWRERCGPGLQSGRCHLPWLRWSYQRPRDRRRKRSEVLYEWRWSKQDVEIVWFGWNNRQFTDIVCYELGHCEEDFGASSAIFLRQEGASGAVVYERCIGDVFKNEFDPPDQGK